MEGTSLLVAENAESPVGQISTTAWLEPSDTARMLFSSSPTKAYEFAVAMHERVSWGFDTDLIEYWADVVQELRQAPEIRLAAE